MVCSMKSFKQFIVEMAMSQSDESETDIVMESLKDLGDIPLLWRGQTAGRKIGKINILYSGVVKVTQENESFRGALNPKVVEVISKLGFNKKPVFCTFNKEQAKFFGPLGVIVPSSDFTMFWNNKIKDLLVDIENYSVKEIINSYESSNTIDKVHDGEILIKCDQYFWITPSKFFELVKKSKFNKFKSLDEVKTYNDLYEVYKLYKSYLKWLKRNQHENI